MSQNHQEHIGLIWSIANLLRGPYRPPQYRRVMLPMTVLRRLDCVLEPTKDAVLAEYSRIKGKPAMYVTARLNKLSGYKFHNTSQYTFRKLLGEPDNIAKNLLNHIKGFSDNARRIFEFFKFEQEIEKLDDSNRLFLIVKEFTKVDFHPVRVPNADMGAIFEELLVSKIFDNREFGFAKMVVERPLRLNFQASPERIERLKEEKAFQALAESKKRKDKKNRGQGGGRRPLAAGDDYCSSFRHGRDNGVQEP